MLETWDWYIDRFIDMPVADIVRRRAFREPVPVYGGRLGVEFIKIEPHELRYRAEDIARVLHRSEKSVFKSLLRLERRGKVESDQWGWRWKG